MIWGEIYQGMSQCLESGDPVTYWSAAGCVDVMEMKVLRDAGAAHFDIPFIFDLSWTQLEDLLPAGSDIFLADSSSNSDTSAAVVDYTQPNYSESSHVVLVVGGETEGLSRCASRLCASSKWRTRRIHIPMAAGINSLNSAVSASVILYEMWRQMILAPETLKSISGPDADS